MDPKTEQDKPTTGAPTEDATKAKAGGATGGSDSDATGNGQSPQLTDDVQRYVDRITSKMHEKMQREFQERLEGEKKRLDEERLREQGEFKRLFEERDAELQALKAQQAAEKFRADALQVLAEQQLTDLGDVLLAPVDSIGTLKKQADAIKKIIEARVEAEVEKRLDTGRRPTSGEPGSGEKKRVQDMDERDKAKLITDVGLDKYLETVLEQ